MDDFSAPYDFSEYSHLQHKGVHLGVCGSIAAFRAPDLVRWWLKSNIRVSVTVTDAGQKFIAPLSFEALGAGPVYTDFFSKETTFGHLEPGQTASVLVIAPASAHTLAQIAGGHADTMLACQALAFDGPIIVAPAMNPRMWKNPATQENIARLQARNVTVITPAIGGTACGDEGQGRLASLQDIWLSSIKAMTKQDMQGHTVMVTLGPTRETWDAVRFWSNPSTGSMGAALAISAWLRGAHVHAICGPVNQEYCKLPSFITRHNVTTAQEMYTAAKDLWPRMDMGIFTAAVADYAPKPYGNEKFKKANASQGLHVEFSPNVDILRSLAAEKTPQQKLLGFAAETTPDLGAAVQQKLASKGADIIAGNNIAQAHCGFASATNTMVVADKNGRQEQWPSLKKIDVAWRLCSWLMEI